ncbi:glycosyltransferase family 2 protein [Anabaena subtropica]|uniref:Glycosyltransferase n=1 Tax=Anabaena subtropica FACHB-260 TaxID=2692884 RepID=A0ABR8CSV5_9NOST|nr:glycosyltransferase [Anabaena subtropica]MBD2346054.1 glycosyltransferase [Anabaena subtropica FACHB-260]
MVAIENTIKPNTDTKEPNVTIVVVPRERFSYAQKSLESIYEYTTCPFKLVYVDGGSPTKIRRYLEAQSQAKGFKLIRTEEYLSPNLARNIGVSQVDTEYTVFVDNDVIVSPQWLEKLLECADDTKAAIVGPLTCISLPLHSKVHCAGGLAHILESQKDGQVKRRIREKQYYAEKKLENVRDRLHRMQTGLAEFHCMLARTDVFAQVGLLDEGLLNTREHIDFCMLVTQVGGTIYFEPDSVVTYVPGPPMEVYDIPYYLLRWSDGWEMDSLTHLQEKWNLSDDSAFFKMRRNRLGWRRHIWVVKPIVRRLNFGKPNPWLEKVLEKADRIFNRYWSDRYTRQRAKMQLPEPINTHIKSISQ